jgi:uncharacterized membrane protein YedE/YeeE
VTVAIAGLATGLAFGALLTRGGICFNRGVRRALLDRDPSILRMFALIVSFELILLPVLYVLEVEPLASNVDAGAPALLPVAQLAGGLVFGVGMALAGGCITGILWKAGAGSVATAIAILGFAAGELLATGVAAEALRSLDDAGRPPESSLTELSGLPFELLAPAIGIAALAMLARRRDDLRLGLALGAVAALAWVAADIAEYGYGLGFVGAAERTRDALSEGGALPFQLFLAAGVLAGGALVARRPPRTPTAGRGIVALAGGMLMGLGANAAHGCNIGHGVTGLGLLSLGSLVAVAAMAIGAVGATSMMRRSPRWRTRSTAARAAA